MKPQLRESILPKTRLHRAVKRKLLLQRNSRRNRARGAEIAQDHAKCCSDMQQCLRNPGTPHRAYALAHLAQSVVMYDRAIDGLQALRDALDDRGEV